MKHLHVLCPQEYEGAIDMIATPCSRCVTGWSKELGRCTIPTGAEHLPLGTEVPICPIQDRCQHQLQSGDEPCVVRARGLICESALTFAGVPDAASHPLSFNAQVCASAEELY